MSTDTETTAGSGYWVECDGCDEEVAYDQTVDHPAHDVSFCSRSCLHRWLNHLGAQIR